MAPNFSIKEILENMRDPDSDKRVMGAEDLINFTQEPGFRLDYSESKRIIKQLQAMITDHDADVRNYASQALGAITPFLEGAFISEILTTTSDIFLTSEEHRDIGSMAMKEVLLKVRTDQPKRTQALLSEFLRRFIEKTILDDSTTAYTMQEALSILSESIARYGHLLHPVHKFMLDTFMAKFKVFTTHSMVIKCIAELSKHVPQALFSSIIENIIKELRAESIQYKGIYIRLLDEVSRRSGEAMEAYLDQVLPLVIKTMNIGDPEEDDDDDTAQTIDNLRESCLQCFGSVLVSCPKGVGKFIPEIIDSAVDMLDYDPYYKDDISDSEDGDSASYEQKENGFKSYYDEIDSSEEDEFMEDEDGVSVLSWKLRKAAARCLGIVARYRPESLELLYTIALDTLVYQIGKEHSETVLFEFLVTLGDIFRQTHAVYESRPVSSTIAEICNDLLPEIVTVLSDTKEAKAPKTKEEINKIFQAVTSISGVKMPDFFPVLSFIKHCLLDKSPSNSALVILSLETLSEIVSRWSVYDSDSCRKVLDEIAARIGDLMLDTYYKVSVAAIRSAVQIVSKTDLGRGRDLAKIIVEKLLPVMSLENDAKIEIIKATGVIMAKYGKEVSFAKDPIGLLHAHMENDGTRISAIQTFAELVKAGVASPSDGVAKMLANFFRQRKREFRQASLLALREIVVHGGLGVLSKETVDLISEQMVPLVSDKDLQITHLCLQLATEMLKNERDLAAQLRKDLIPRVLEFLSTPILQGGPLETTIQFFEELYASGIDVSALIDDVLGLVTKNKGKTLPRGAISSVARVIARLAIKSSTWNDLVAQSVSTISNPKEEDHNLVILHLEILGHIGKEKPLTKWQEVILESVERWINSSDDAVQTSAALSLGEISCGNLKEYLKYIIKMIETKKNVYLYFTSVKVIINYIIETGESSLIQKEADQVLDLLLNSVSTKESGNREIVSECLGKLCLFEPERIFTVMYREFRDGDAYARATLIGAFKFAMVDSAGDEYNALLENYFSKIVAVKDEELFVRISLVEAINYAAKRNPQILRKNIGSVIEFVVSECKFDEKYYSVVRVGSAVHIMDKKVEHRRLGYETLIILTKTAYDILPFDKILDTIVTGLEKEKNGSVKVLVFTLLCQILLKNRNLVEPKMEKIFKHVAKILEDGSVALKKKDRESEGVVKWALKFVAMMQEGASSIKMTVLDNLVDKIIRRSEGLSKIYDAILSGEIDMLDGSPVPYSSPEHFGI